MASYNLKFNSDDSVVRHIIIGLLADLNNKLYFHRQLSNDNRVIIDVPFYYSITGDDQFLRDQFLFSTPSGTNCQPDAGFADGNYDAIPRGIANLTSLGIDSSKLVNKRTVGNYTKMNEEGAMEGYVSEFEMIPITLGLEIEILTSSTIDSLKITEAIIKKLYKSNQFNVEVGHLNEGTYRLASYYAMPDDYEIQRPIDFTFDDKESYKITFPIEINSFIPSFDFETEQHIGNRMFEIISNVIITTPAALPQSIDTMRINSTGKIATPIYDQLATYDINGLHLPSTPESVQHTQFIDSTQIVTSPLLINPGQINQDFVLIATNGDIIIDISNFNGVSAVTIHDGGSLTIKWYINKWYVTGFTNSTVVY